MTDFSDVVVHFDSEKEKTYRDRDGATWKRIWYPDFRESTSLKAWRYASDQGQLLSRDLRILSSKPGKGYVTTTLSIHIEGTYGATTHTTLHRIIAFTFLGPPPDKLSVYTVDHINRNKEDNRAVNLQWATPQEQLANREMSWYQLQTTDGRTFSSVAQLAKETNIQGKALRTQLRQAVEGNVVIVNDVQIRVEGVRRTAVQQPEFSRSVRRYGGVKKSRNQRDVALDLFLEGKSVIETAEEMGLKLKTVLSYLAIAARESPRTLTEKLADRLDVASPLIRQQLQDDILQYNQSFQTLRDQDQDQADPDDYVIGYRQMVVHRLPNIGEDWQVIQGMFQSVYHMLK